MEDKEIKKLNKGLMTTGHVGRQLVYFAMPLLLGNLFQQFYNAVDSAIVGQYVGKEALAAVGSSASLINLVVSLFMGIAIGGTVCVSQYYGARDAKRLHNAVHTIIAFSIISGIAMSVLGALLSKSLLILMGTPDDVIELSTVYFRIFFGGSIGIVVYNMGSGLLRAVGDSKRPLYYLIFSSLLNVAFDFLFVGYFKWGVAGAAAATDAAQFVSAILVIATLMKSNEGYKVILKDIKIYKEEMKKVIVLGVPSGIQNAIVSISNVFVQSSINVFGSIAVAGCGAYMKIDGFVLLPALSFSMAMTTFVGQNMGAGELGRVKEGLKKGTFMGLATIFIIVVALQFITAPMLHLFTSDTEVINVGVSMMRLESIGYLLVSFTHLMAGVLRGAGLTKVPMYVMVGCWCVLRMAWIIFIAKPMDSLIMVLAGYPVSWFVSAIIMIIYIWRVDWIHYYDRVLKD